MKANAIAGFVMGLVFGAMASYIGHWSAWVAAAAIGVITILTDDLQPR